MVLGEKSLQEYRVNVLVPQGSIVGPTFFILYINDLPDYVICNVAIYAGDTALYCKYEQASDLWWQLKLVCELESDLQDTADWGRNWFSDWSAGKIQLVLFDWSNNTRAIHLKMDGSFVEENHLLKCWDCFSLLNWIGALKLSLLLKLPPRKLEPCFLLWSFFLVRVLCISINPPYGLAWNTVVMSGLVLLAASWNC